MSVYLPVNLTEERWQLAKSGDNLLRMESGREGAGPIVPVRARHTTPRRSASRRGNSLAGAPTRVRATSDKIS